jgi:hypothetical protein
VLRFQFEPRGHQSLTAGGREFQPGLLSGEIERVLVTVQKSVYVRVRVRSHGCSNCRTLQASVNAPPDPGKTSSAA